MFEENTNFTIIFVLTLFIILHCFHLFGLLLNVYNNRVVFIVKLTVNKYLYALHFAIQ